MVRHLHFTQSLEPLLGAGLGYAALGMHENLIACGVDSQLVATADKGFSNDWPGVTLFTRRGPQKAFYSPEMCRQSAALVGQHDVIHGHGFYVTPNWTFGHASRKQNRPLVYHPHGFLDPWVLARSRWKKRIAHFLFEDANFRHVQLWRALSRKEESQIRDQGIRAKIIVLPNGVHMPMNRTEDEVLALCSRFPKVRPKRLLFLSRIHPKKGLDLLIHAWGRMDQAVHDEWELALFGPDEGGYASEIKKWIHEGGLSDRVRLMGSVSGEAKEAAFRSADLFVLPSYSEGFPMAVLEAASYGLPVVQTSECNFPELIAAGGGWQCLPTVESLIPALADAVLCSDSERRQRGFAGQKLVANNYQWKQIAAQLDAACHDLYAS